MSNIRNEPRITNPIVVKIREQLEHRALWMYLLCDEAAKHGLKASEYAPDAIRRCGLYQGAELRQKAGGGESLKGLKKTLFSKFAQWVFEMEIRRLCDYAMCGDGGIAASFGCELDLPATIARGDDICQIRFVRRDNESPKQE